MQFGLALAICRAQPALGRIAFAWAAVLNLGRIYLGMHFPTDIVGGAALGILAVNLGEFAASGQIGRWLLARERATPGAFYMVAFFLSYQIATLFDEARSVALAALRLLMHGPAHTGL